MGLFNTDYSKPGPGVSKNERKKKGLARFYQIFFRKFWNLIELNILYIVTLLPTFAVVFLLSGMISNKLGVTPEAIRSLAGTSFSEVEAARMSITMDLLTRLYISIFFAIFWGGGPVTAGFVYILRSFMTETPVFLLSDYFGHVVSNFKQSIAVYIIDLIVFTILCYAYFFYGSMTTILFYLKYVILVLAFFYTITHLYLYHLLVTYKLKLWELYKNSALFAISALPYSVITIAAVAFSVLIWPAIGFTAASTRLASAFTIAVFVLLFALQFSACGLYIESNAITQIKKYIKEDANVETK
ncbi:MAG: hypothetical protein ACI38A_02525 [Candidatus Ornithomonoglobus sp.]